MEKYRANGPAKETTTFVDRARTANASKSFESATITPGDLLFVLIARTSFTRLVSLACERPETAQDRSVGQFWATYFAASFPVKPSVSG